jgi:hypothetical protein
MPLFVLAMKNKIQMLSEVFAFFIVEVTDHLQDRPTSAAGFELGLLLINVLEQRPDHFRAIGEFLIQSMEFHHVLRYLISGL